jgi:hypothetical protein
MAATISISPQFPASFCGITSIFEYRNQDGLHTWNCCGQAAMATLLTRGGVQTIANWKTNVRDLEEDHPPDIAWGYFGTSQARMGQMASVYGKPLKIYGGYYSLKAAVASQKPVAVMLEVSKGKAGGASAQGLAGHWLIVFGYDEKNVYTTNFGGPFRRIDWYRFELGWESWMPAAIGMQKRAISIF